MNLSNDDYKDKNTIRFQNNILQMIVLENNWKKFIDNYK